MQMKKSKFNLICSGLLTSVLIACGSSSKDSTSLNDADDISKPLVISRTDINGEKFKMSIEKRSAVKTELKIGDQIVELSDIGWAEVVHAETGQAAVLRNYTKIESGGITGYLYRENNLFFNTFDERFLTGPKKLWADIVKSDSAAYDDGMEFFSKITFKKQHFKVDTTIFGSEKCILLMVPKAFYFDQVGNSDLNTYVEYNLESKSIIGFPDKTSVPRSNSSSHLDKCPIVNVKDL